MAFGLSRLRGFRAAVLAFIGLAIMAGPAAAGQPEPWQMNMQDPASPVMTQIYDLHNYITIIMIGIVLLVMGLLGYCIFRFNAKKNPTPSKTSHNTLLEIAWTAIPVLILVAIAVPSFRLLYFMDRTQEAEMTLKVIGHQWYWSFEYPDHGNVALDSFMKYPEDLEEGEPRLLAVDTPVVLPEDTNIRIITTASDVIHSFAIPALGLKTDAIPGRLNETWVRVEEPGMYYGQCSELCGVNHGFMPAALKIVPKDEFEAWMSETQAAQGIDPAQTPATELASR
ncbi:Cytochrome c oxidase polypeptide II [Caenispirillum salinarum AK4]|uniref:Cytochrome c oxidase subunit 2 n=1 Tax=Caenispirillum salinarum AK4 TaxID=1238182 RepID=K9GZQ0_9PROT|nr:cytochrome c oxidase subunit II [Caenispirillum salinarum]EKV31465.1 Cytochrome c oxidase polypeptide II [Caenispirillum salinarum AK4]